MERAGTFIFITIAWVFSVCVHEFAHAVVAYKGGDTSVREKGYLTMNPLRYLHPMYSLLMPVVFLMLGGIGLPGGAVYVNHAALRSRRWDSAVSLAGPAGSALFALVVVAAYHAVPAGSMPVRAGLAFLAMLQVSAVVLNLLPVPPLDGYGIIRPYLSLELQAKLLPVSRYGVMILFGILWFVEPASDLFWDMVFGTLGLLGVDPIEALEGFLAFRFWESGG